MRVATCCEVSASLLLQDCLRLEKIMPVFVVQGTGRAADLIADCLIYYREDSSGKIRDGRLPPAPVLLRQCLIARYEELMRTKSASELSKRPQTSVVSGELICAVQALFSEYNIMPRGEKDQDIIKMMGQLQTVVTSGLCLDYRMGGQVWLPIR